MPGFFKKVETPTHLNGYICHTTVNPLGQSPTHIVGVYMPEEKDKRARSYEHIKQIIEICTAGRMNLLLAGDWNAVLMASDRTGPLDTADRCHMEFCRTNHLVPLGGRANRKHTSTGPTATSYAPAALMISSTCNYLANKHTSRHPNGHMRPAAPWTTLPSWLIALAAS